MNVNKSSMRLVAMAAAVGIVAVGLGIWATLAGGGDAGAQTAAPAIRMAEAPHEGKPTALTTEQCTQAGHIVDDMRSNGLKQMAAHLDDAGMNQAQTEATSSDAWVANGCPPDSVRGFYPAASGQGGELRVFTSQTFSSGGTLSAK